MSLKKSFVILLALCTLLPLTASATLDRVIGLGGNRTNYIVHDHANVGIWPQLLHNYDRQAGANFNNDAGQYGFSSAYVNWDFDGDDTDGCVLQMALDRTNMRNFGWSAPQGTFAALDGINGGYNKLNATIGCKMGEDMLVGATLHWAGKSAKTDNSNGATETDNSYSEIGLKLGLTAMESKLDLGLGFNMGSWSMESGGNVMAEADGAMTIMIDGRYWHTFSESYSLIPNIEIALHNDGAKDGSSPVNSASANGTTIKLGVGNNWTPADNMLALAEFGFLMDGTKYEAASGGTTTEGTNSETDIYWRLGFETEIFPWLDGRFGAERMWSGMTQEWNGGVAPGNPEWSSSITYTYLGATAHWNRLWVDTIVNPSFLGNGPNFVSGYTDMLFWRSGLTYFFGEGQ